MTRFIFAGILLLSLYSCDDKEVETYRHEIPHGHHLLQGDVESYNQLILPPVECAVEFTGDRNETVEVSYFYMEKDTNIDDFCIPHESIVFHRMDV